MELLQLKYFMRVAEMGHLTRAAESLYISQPALSRAIRRLEAELGIPVFARKGRGIELTEYGQHFYARVQSIFSELEQDRLEREDILGHHSQPVRVGTTVPGISLPVLESYHEKEPDIKFFHTSPRENDTLFTQLSGGQLDVGFCDASVFPADLEHRIIWKDQLYALIPTNHPMAQAQSLSFKELSYQPLVLSNSESTLWDLIRLFNGGKEPHPYMSAASMPEALRLCSMGMGITITSGFFLEVEMRSSMHDGKSILDFAIPVPLDNCTWNISVVWKRQSYYTLQLRAFLAHVISYYQTQSEQSILQTIVRKEPYLGAEPKSRT